MGNDGHVLTTYTIRSGRVQGACAYKQGTAIYFIPGHTDDDRAYHVQIPACDGDQQRGGRRMREQPEYR